MSRLSENSGFSVIEMTVCATVAVFLIQAAWSAFRHFIAAQQLQSVYTEQRMPMEASLDLVVNELRAARISSMTWTAERIWFRKGAGWETIEYRMVSDPGAEGFNLMRLQTDGFAYTDRRILSRRLDSPADVPLVTEDLSALRIYALQLRYSPPKGRPILVSRRAFVRSAE
jgi:hypothetical protein